MMHFFERNGFTVTHGEQIGIHHMVRVLRILLDAYSEVNKPARLQALTAKKIQDIVRPQQWPQLPLPPLVVDSFSYWNVECAVYGNQAVGEFSYGRTQKVYNVIADHLGMYLVKNERRPH